MNQIEHKVGIKILDENQLRNVMPTYDNLFRKIDACRNVAYEKLVDKDKDKKHYQYNFMYDNVFSILGQRGTGKTSVAFTLWKQIEKKYSKNYYDVVLPIIIPEVIPDNCTVIGWILAIVKEEIQKLSEKRRNIDPAKSSCNNSWDRCRYDEDSVYERLLTTYDDLIEMLYAGSYNPSSESSYYRAVGNSVKQADNYYQFAKKIAELWDIWIISIQRVYKLKKNKDMKKCPMIYFIFDDVDLAPARIREMLSVIVKYLAHPNIVVIVTCHEELVLEVIENRMDLEIGRLPKEWRAYLNIDKKGGEDKQSIGGNLYAVNMEGDLVEQTTKMYLGKVLPPSTRYYLQLFRTAKQKELFRITGEDNLGQNIKKQIDRLLDSIDGNKSKPDNFMYIHGKIINVYLKFIGNTSRQINNVYLAIKELVDNLLDIIDKRKNSNTDIIDKSKNSNKDNEQLFVEIYQNIRYFMCISINANHELSNRIGQIYDFVDEVFLPEYNEWKFFCSYHCLNKYLQSKFEGEAVYQKIEIAIELYSLLLFVENILLILESCIEGGITGRLKVHGIIHMNGHLANDVFEGRFLFRTDLGADEFFCVYMDLINNLVTMAEEKMSDARFDLEYFYLFWRNTNKFKASDINIMYQYSQKWFKEISGMLAMVYGNAYLINKDDMEECMLYPKREYLIRYQYKMNTEIKANIRKCFLKTKMHQVWEGDIKHKIVELKVSSVKNNELFESFVQEIRNVFLKEETDIEERGKTWIRLGQIFDETVGRLQDWIYDGEKIKYFPEKIVSDLYEAKDNMIKDSSVTKNLMLRYMEKIAGDFAGQYIELNNIAHAMTVLDNCSEQYLSMAADIRDMQRRIEKMLNPKKSMVRIDRKTYKALVKLLIKVIKRASQTMTEDIYWGDESRLIFMVQEIFTDMDAVVEKNEDAIEEFYKAVEFCTQFAFVQGLQEIYLFQIVHERYENHSSRSSADLEMVKDQDTYYKQMFELINNMLNNPDPDIGRGESVVLHEKIKADINEAVTQARNNYFDAMIAEMNNE